jgi:hypothetical protein
MADAQVAKTKHTLSYHRLSSSSSSSQQGENNDDCPVARQGARIGQSTIARRLASTVGHGHYDSIVIGDLYFIISDLVRGMSSRY